MMAYAAHCGRENVSPTLPNAFAETLIGPMSGTRQL
jgi:hypothetical protein